MGKKKLFDILIGNPPYQDETLGDNAGFAPPVYNKFLDNAFEVAHKVEMIHPARFLFNAGSTPKSWNEAMLHNNHFKVLNYADNASTIFPNTDIKGGVAVTYYDDSKDFGEIGIFTPYPELNSILKKTLPSTTKESIETIGVSGYSYHFTPMLYRDYPQIKHMTYVAKGKTLPLISKGHEYDLKSNIIEKLTMVFHDTKPNDGRDYAKIIGRADGARVTKYINREYLNNVSNFESYKLIIPKASGIGAFGEPLGPSITGQPHEGHTETFFSIGSFPTKAEAENLYKYLKGKFARALLSVSKKTQNITPGNFKYIPLQDFTAHSDIDWSQSIHDIDLQLYKKYSLTADEIDFIETHVKEVA